MGTGIGKLFPTELNEIQKNRVKYSGCFKDIVFVTEEIQWHPHRFYKPCYKDKDILIESTLSRIVGDKTPLWTQLQDQFSVI